MAYEILCNKSYDFALRVVKMYKYLEAKRKNYCMADQVLRSATSIGANIREGVFAQSRTDNIAKFSISLKEANESLYWLRLLTDGEYITKAQGESLKNDCTELIKMLVVAIKTLKNNKNNNSINRTND